MDLGPDNAVWDDGEWVSWESINSHLQYLELKAQYPNGDVSLVPFFEDLLALARSFYLQTDRHLQVYGDIGELYGAITYGVRLNRNFAQGSDGKVGNDHVEIKTLAPFAKHDRTRVKLTSNFNKLLVVKIDEDFVVSGRMIDRRQLPKSRGNLLWITWDDLPS